MLIPRKGALAPRRVLTFLVCFCSLLSLPAAARDAAPSVQAKPQTTSIQPSLKQYVRVYRSVMAPKIVADVFGRRIAKNYVAIQVTVTNRNTQYQFLLHDISLDLTSVFPIDFLNKLKQRQAQMSEARLSEDEVNELHQLQKNAPTEADEARLEDLEDKLLPLPSGYELSSDELSLVRGVAEKGQMLDPRNMFLRYLRAVGTVAGGITGVTHFGSSFAPSVAAYNGPFLTAYTDAFPDFTVNQMNRLNDSAYAANKIVAKQHSLILVAFVPQAQFMSNSLRKQFWKDPTSIQKDIDFRLVVVKVDGVFITEVVEQQPSVTSVVIDPDEMKKFGEGKPQVKGSVIGQSLGGSTLKLKNDKPEGLSISVKGTPEDKRIEFTIASDKPVAPGTVLQFEVSKKEGNQTTSTTVAYQPGVPTLESIDPASVATGIDEKSVKLIGANFLPDGVHVLSSGVCGEQEAKSVAFVDPKTLTATITFPKGMKAGDCSVRVSTPGGISGPVKLEVKEAPTK